MRVDAMPGVAVVDLETRTDERGWLMELWRRDRDQPDFAQDNLSSSQRGVVRGLHYRASLPQGKLVQVLTGEVFDVAVDLRRGSPTFGSWFGVVLSGQRPQQLWIPPGCAHGFQTLSERAILFYKLTAVYDPDDERALRWDDPELAIDWPIRDGVILSPRDAAAPGWAQFLMR